MKAAAGSSSSGGVDLLDILGDDLGVSTQNNVNAPVAQVVKVPCLTAEQGKGISISAGMTRVDGDQVAVHLGIGNTSPTATQSLAIQLNKNCFGLVPVNPGISLPSPIANGQAASVVVTLKSDPAAVNAQALSPTIQAAIKNMATQEVSFLHLPVQMEALFTP